MKRGSYVRGDLAILEAGFAALEQAVLVHDKDGRIVACNPAAAKLGDSTVDDILGRSVDDYEQNLRYRDGSPVTRENSRLLHCIRTGEPQLDVLVEIEDDPKKPTRWVSASYVPLFHEGETEAWGAVSSVAPVPPERAEAQNLLEARIEHTPVGLLTVDRDGCIEHANAEARALCERCDALQLAVDGRDRLADLLDDGDTTVQAAIEAGQRLSLTRCFERLDGDDLWLAIDVAPIEIGGAMCVLRDVTEERERLQELAHFAFHDPLTGLPNRRFTEEELAKGLARARRQGGGVGVVFVDLDGLKPVNDDFGHAAGDDVLIEFAERLQSAVRESDAIGRVANPASVVARRGGDEFLIVLTDLPADCATLLAEIVQRIETALEPPFHAAGHELRMSASIGAAAYPYDSQDPTTLLEMANAAMRADKRNHQR